MNLPLSVYETKTLCGLPGREVYEARLSEIKKLPLNYVTPLWTTAEKYSRQGKNSAISTACVLKRRHRFFTAQYGYRTAVDDQRTLASSPQTVMVTASAAVRSDRFFEDRRGSLTKHSSYIKQRQIYPEIFRQTHRNPVKVLRTAKALVDTAQHGIR